MSQLNTPPSNTSEKQSFLSKLNLFSKGKSETTTLKEAVDAYFEEAAEDDEPTSDQEQLLIRNVISLRDLNADDVMIPRADIVAVDVNTEQAELFELFSKVQFSRFPIYQDSLDNIIGSIHIKDVIAELAKGNKIDIRALLKTVPITSPAMPVLDLMHMMQSQRRHMILVVDEYGGIDGLVTIGDIIEAVLGEFQDEYDLADRKKIIELGKGEYIADARTYLSDVEEVIGRSFEECDIDEDAETIGGLISATIGRLPVRGEILKDEKTSLFFEILDADPRRIKKVKFRELKPVVTKPKTE